MYLSGRFASATRVVSTGYSVGQGGRDFRFSEIGAGAEMVFCAGFCDIDSDVGVKGGCEGKKEDEN